MFSYQNEYLALNEDPAKIYKFISDWELSKERKEMVAGWEYYLQNNPAILEAKRYYYSAPRKKVVNGKEITIGGGAYENKYVANFKIGYGIAKDIISQKVNTLLNELPNIETHNKYKFNDKFIKNFGFALKLAGVRASAQGVAYIYQDYYNSFKVFESENVIGFFDDLTSELRTAIRYWRIKYNNGQSEKLFFEIYKETSMITYSTNIGGSKQAFEIVIAETPYKFKAIKDIDENKIINEGIKLPINVLWNSQTKQSDLTKDLLSKIDAIDLVNSGFANNIADFSELIWVINNYTGRNYEELEDFIANINQTRKLIVDGNGANVDTKQINIPTEARTKFVEDRKKEIIEETGVIDTASMTGGSLTTTAIKAATMRLLQRVSDFEWQVYEVATKIIELYQRYNNLQFDFDVTFTKLLISNDTEIIDNAVKIREDISKKTLLEIYKRAGYVNNVEEELKQIEDENINKFFLAEGVDDGQGTQTDGQDIGGNAEDIDKTISADL